MRSAGRPRFFRVALLAIALASVANLTGAPANAQTTYCWIDAATGNPAPLYPPGWLPTGMNPNTSYSSNPDPNHVTFGGHNYVRLPDGNWIDAATGNPAPLYPPGWLPTGMNPNTSYSSNPDPNHVTFGGHNYVLVPCPSPAQPVQAAPSPVVPLLPNVGIGFGFGRSEDRPDRR
jgi:hypothetical protein